LAQEDPRTADALEAEANVARWLKADREQKKRIAKIMSRALSKIESAYESPATVMPQKPQAKCGGRELRKYEKDLAHAFEDVLTRAKLSQEQQDVYGNWRAGQMVGFSHRKQADQDTDVAFSNLRRESLESGDIADCLRLAGRLAPKCPTCVTKKGGPRRPTTTEMEALKLQEGIDMDEIMCYKCFAPGHGASNRACPSYGNLVPDEFPLRAENWPTGSKALREAHARKIGQRLLGATESEEQAEVRGPFEFCTIENVRVPLSADLEVLFEEEW
jgi:hypothetical protein